MRLIRQIAPAILAAILVIAFAFWGGTKTLGAHPFWHLNVALVGAPVGAVVALLANRFRKVPMIVLMGTFTVVAYSSAHWGKTAFAASFAENALAGKFWYFGWIATSTGAAALIARIITPRR